MRRYAGCRICVARAQRATLGQPLQRCRGAARRLAAFRAAYSKTFAFSAWNGDPSLENVSSEAGTKLTPTECTRPAMLTTRLSLPTTEPTIIQGGDLHTGYTRGGGRGVVPGAITAHDEMSRHAIAYVVARLRSLCGLIQEETPHSYTAWRRYPACPTMHAHGPGCSYSLGTPRHFGGSSQWGARMPRLV